MASGRTETHIPILIIFWLIFSLFSPIVFGDLVNAEDSVWLPSLAEIKALGVQDDPEDDSVSGLREWIRENRVYYWNALKKAQINYWNEVYRSRGIRLFLKDHDSKAETDKLWADLQAKLPADEARARFEELRPPKEKYFGAMTEYRPPDPFRWYHYAGYLKLHQVAARESTKRSDRFDHTPYSITWGKFADKVVDLPARGISRALFNCDKDLGFFSHLALGIASGVYIWNRVFQAGNDKYEEVLGEEVVRGIEANAPLWNWRVEFNGVYRDIFEEREKGEITPQIARQKAYRRSIHLAQYYEGAAARDVTDPKVQEELLTFGPFASVRAFKEKGITKDESYGHTEAFHKYPTPEQISKLVLLTVEKLDTFEMVRRIYAGDKDNEPLVRANPERLAAMRQENPDVDLLVDFRKKLESRPYIRALLALHDRGALSDDELFSRIEEDIAWKIRVDEQKVLGIVPLEIDKLGNPVPISDKDFLKRKRNAHLDELALRG
jgi:hypothetical protein